MKRLTSDGRYVLQKGEYERKDQKGFIYKWRDAYGKQCSVSALELKDLREKVAQLKSEQGGMEKASQQKRTLRQYYELWLRQKQRSNIKSNVLSNYKYMYERFVDKSRIAKMAIKDIKKSDVKELYGTLVSEKGLAVSTVDSIHTVLHQVLQVAVDDDIIRKNPSDNVMKELKASAPKQKVKALTPEEQARFLEVIAGTKWEPVFVVMLNTGMRIAELSAFRWDDVITIEGEEFIHVQRNFIYYRDNLTDKHKGELLMERRIQSTKTTAGDRLIKVNEEIRRSLKWQRENGRPSIDEVESDEGTVSGFVFANKAGRCFNQQSLNRALKRIQKEANADPNAKVLLPNLYCHLLRKTFCTNLARERVPLAVAAKLMGHSDIDVTAAIYTEIQPDMVGDVADVLQGFFDGLRNSEKK